MSSVASEIVWSREDLDIFSVEGFSERMSAIRARVQPQLAAISARLSEPLTRLAGAPLYPHVAKHMRRTVNPPPETWVAWGPSQRGYKKYCCFMFAVSLNAVHARLVVKNEATDRAERASRLRAAAGLLTRETAESAIRDYFNWDTLTLPRLERKDEEFWHRRASKLALKSGSLDLGIAFQADSSGVRLRESELVAAYEALAPIYRVLK